MFALTSRHARLRQRRSVLPRLLVLAMSLALGACDGGDSPLSPAEDPLAPATEPAPAEAVAPDNVLALTTSQRIAFSSYRNGYQPDIYKMDPQGNNLVPLTTGSGDYDATPAWSYDNKRIALRRLRPNGKAYIVRDIYVINADGSNGHWARPTPFPFDLSDPSWSPDGSRIILSVALNGGWYLAWMDVATGQVNLVDAAAGGRYGQYPSFDATGQKVVYVSKDGRTIVQINADGSGQKNLFSSATIVRNPTFSPDGKKIAFDQIVGASNNQEIFVQNLVTGTTKRLTYVSAPDGQPTWSPDGTRIAFTSKRSGQYQIWTMPSSGGSPTRITHTSVDEVAPRWSH